MLPFHTFLQIRVYLYHQQVISEDVESQKKGVVKVTQLDKEIMTPYFEASPEEKEDMMDCAIYLPFRYSAQHFCMPEECSSLTEHVMKGLWWALNHSKVDRFNMKVYSSLDTEVCGTCRIHLLLCCD